MGKRRFFGQGPEGEVHEHDLGLAHDMQKMMSRRGALALFGAAGAATLVACGTSSSESKTPAAGSSAAGDTSTTGVANAVGECVDAAPQETAGPYPGDGSNGPNVLIESGIVRQDITTSFGSMSGTAEGVPVTITMALQDLTKDCDPGQGMAVYIWHCDRDGEYSLYGSKVADQNYLRGVQVAGADGTVSFTSIFPGCYSGRWPHIHFEVFDSLESAVAGSDARLTSQIALPEDASMAVYTTASGYEKSVTNLKAITLAKDNVFGDGWDAELATAEGSAADGYKISITVGVAEKSENTQAAPPGGGGPGGEGGPGGQGGPGGMPPEGMTPPDGMTPPGGMPAAGSTEATGT